MMNEELGTNDDERETMNEELRTRNQEPETRPSASYGLRVADGQRWQLLARDHASGWLRELASIMELKPSKGECDHRIVFVSSRRGTKDGRSSVSGPSLVKYPLHPHPNDVIVELPPVTVGEEGYAAMSDALLPIFSQVTSKGGLPFHSALVEKDGKGILLGGTSGIGKSTCSRRIPRPWRALADDLALIVRTGDRSYAVHPLPTWSDYFWHRGTPTWRVETSVPLSAVFLLERSEHDLAAPVGQGEAALRLYRLAGEASRLCLGRASVPELKPVRLDSFDSASAIARAVPCFTLKVSLKGRFWEEIERVVSW
jgi:SynChlorMet cassette protein ScmC